MVIPPTKVITDSEGDENDIPRHSVDRPPVIVPDPSEVQPPRLLAASLDPQAERDKEKVLNVQHPSCKVLHYHSRGPFRLTIVA